MGRKRRRGRKDKIITTTDDLPSVSEPGGDKRRRQPEQPQLSKKERQLRLRLKQDEAEAAAAQAVAEVAAATEASAATAPDTPKADAPRQCFWCVNATEDDIDGRCLACRAKYEAEPSDTSLKDTHAVFVQQRLSTLTPKKSRAAEWRAKLLAGCEGLPAVVTTPCAGGLDLKVGPFLLRRSGKQGQRLEEFYAAVTSANAVLESLIDCFACLATNRGHEPEATHEHCNQCRTFLEAELRRLQGKLASDGHGHGHAAAAAAAGIVCVRDAIKNLKVMLDDSPPLSDAHRKVFCSAAPVLSKKECKLVRRAAETYAAANGWTTKRHIAYPTHDLPTTSLGEAGEMLQAAVETRLIPELAARFDLERSSLSIQEMFVVKYHILSPAPTIIQLTHIYILYIDISHIAETNFETAVIHQIHVSRVSDFSACLHSC